MKTYDKNQIISILLFVVPIVFSVGIHYEKNKNNIYTGPFCVEYDGARQDPRSGDGTKCLEREEKSIKEASFRSALRGLPDGFYTGVILWIIWSFYLHKVEKRRVEKLKTEKLNGRPTKHIAHLYLV